MVFSPRNRHRVIANEFPVFVVGGSPIKFVNQFKYLANIVTTSYDDDILREVKNFFVRTNALLRKFHKCSVSVKIVLFKSFCLSFYDVALWKSYKVGSLRQFRYCYNVLKCFFFGIVDMTV